MTKVFAFGFASIITLISFIQSPFITERSTWFHRLSRPQAEPVLVTPAPMPVVPAAAVRKTAASQPQLHRAKAVRKVASPLHRDTAPSFMCRFSGRTTLNGRPAPDAQVFLWVTTPLAEERRVVRTSADGSYALNFMIKARANEPVDWEIQAQTAETKASPVAGRRILLHDEQVVSIEQGVDLQAD
jgi:hypothetical protein